MSADSGRTRRGGWWNYSGRGLQCSGKARALVILVTGAMLMLSGMLAGCAGPAGYTRSGDAPKWHQYQTPRVASGEVEEAVLRVAASGQSREVGDLEIHYIVTDNSRVQGVRWIVAVSKRVEEEPYAARLVVHYRVVNGKIAAMSDPSEEFFVDADMERAVLRAVERITSSDKVLIYFNGEKEFALSGQNVSRCAARVKVFQGGVHVGGAGNVVAEKTVAYCFLR